MNAFVVAGILLAAVLAAAFPWRGRGRLAAISRRPARLSLRQWSVPLMRWADRSPRRLAGATALIVGVLLLLWHGPVAGLVCAGYAAAGVHAVTRRRSNRQGALVRARATDAISGLACDLRAGLAPLTALRGALPAFLPAVGDGRALADLAHRSEQLTVVEQCRDDPERGEAARRLVAAWQLAEQTGAPLADVLERLDADLRSGERARTLALAQTAGARATAMLLAALPVAGLGLGYAIGVDPLGVLLHTPLGAVLALAAVALQLAGLAWSSRLSRVATTPGTA